MCLASNNNCWCNQDKVPQNYLLSQQYQGGHYQGYQYLRSHNSHMSHSHMLHNHMLHNHMLDRKQVGIVLYNYFFRPQLAER